MIPLVFSTFLLAPAPTTPRDELLRLAPNDAAILIVVQNGSEHFYRIAQSPFAKWFPSTAIGKRLLESADVKQLRESATTILRELDTTPQTFLDDIVGDAVAFAFSPSPGDRPSEERALILIRPRKLETLERLLEKVNTTQRKSGELRAVNKKEHGGASYFERQRAEGTPEYYSIRGGVFAFSSSEPELKAFLDRDKSAEPVAKKTPELVERLNRLGVGGAAGVMLVNPRALDGEIKGRVAAARPDEKRFLARFAEAWAALDTAAVYLAVEQELELGITFRFHPDKQDPELSKWLTGTGPFGAALVLVPEGALFGIGGSFRAAELIDLVASLVPTEAGKPGLKQWIEEGIGPIVGKNNLPGVLGALGPKAALWVDPPAKDTVLPAIAIALELGGPAETRDQSTKSLIQAIEVTAQIARIAYNAKHVDQIEFQESKDPTTGVVIKSLVNTKGFPPGFQPSFAIVKGYLVLATSPTAIVRFNPRAAPPGNEIVVARFSGQKTRAYLAEHGQKLAALLSQLGIVADEAKTLETFQDFAAVLELIDSAEVICTPDENGMRLGLRVKPAKSLGK